MFNQVLKHSALSAKIHAMTGKTLKRSDYDALMNMNSVTALASYLADNTSYADAFQDASVQKLHRTELERRLREHLQLDIKRITPFMNMRSRKFMEIFALEDVISKIKLCLRLIHINHPIQIYEYMSKLSLGKKEIPIDTIAELHSMDEFIELLRDTPYFIPLSVFLGKPALQEMFKMEMALDTYWANMVYRYAKKYLSKAEAKSVLRVYGTEFDLENLAFLLRCKRTFDMTDEEIYASVIPRYYRLKESVVAQIVKCEAYDEAISIIAESTPYGNAFCKEDRFIERRQSEYITNMKRRIYSLNPYSIQSPICYIHLRRIEIDNIVSIIEGIRYGLEPERTSGYLIGYKRKEAKQ